MEYKMHLKNKLELGRTHELVVNMLKCCIVVNELNTP